MLHLQTGATTKGAQQDVGADKATRGDATRLAAASIRMKNVTDELATRPAVAIKALGEVLQALHSVHSAAPGLLEKKIECVCWLAKAHYHQGTFTPHGKQAIKQLLQDEHHVLSPQQKAHLNFHLGLYLNRNKATSGSAINYFTAALLLLPTKDLTLQGKTLRCRCLKELGIAHARDNANAAHHYFDTALQAFEQLESEAVASMTARHSPQQRLIAEQAAIKLEKAKLYLRANAHEAAQRYANDSIFDYGSINDANNIHYAKFFIGKSYFEEKKYTRALGYLRAALDHFCSLNNFATVLGQHTCDGLISPQLFNMAQYYMLALKRTGDTKQVEALLTVMDKALVNQNTRQHQVIRFAFAACYLQQGDWVRANGMFALLNRCLVKAPSHADSNALQPDALRADAQLWLGGDLATLAAHPVLPAFAELAQRFLGVVNGERAHNTPAMSMAGAGEGGGSTSGGASARALTADPSDDGVLSASAPTDVAPVCAGAPCSAPVSPSKTTPVLLRSRSLGAMATGGVLHHLVFTATRQPASSIDGSAAGAAQQPAQHGHAGSNTVAHLP